jgi:hypothetical protein
MVVAAAMFVEGDDEQGPVEGRGIADGVVDAPHQMLAKQDRADIAFAEEFGIGRRGVHVVAGLEKARLDEGVGGEIVVGTGHKELGDIVKMIEEEIERPPIGVQIYGVNQMRE